MKKMDQHQRSLDLIKKFIKETSPEEIERILKEADDMKIEGPTISEYFKLMGGIQRIQELQDDIKKWSDNAFGKYRIATPMAYHLKKEINELINALEIFYQGTYSNVSTEDGIDQYTAKKRRVLFELADCLMLLVDCAAHIQIGTDELLRATEEKLEINKKRKWGTSDENGVVEHIKE
jgi:hypothetical protein